MKMPRTHFTHSNYKTPNCPLSHLLKNTGGLCKATWFYWSSTACVDSTELTSVLSKLAVHSIQGNENNSRKGK
jgi:hypothetical protein